jgi:hypothetical protein
MQELKDYSGPFVRNIRFEDFSKEALGRLLQACCREILVLDAYWQEQMRKRVGEDAVRECLIENYTRIGKHEMKWTMEALNIKGNDVEAYAKANQFLPSFAQGFFDFDWDVKNKNHAILTVQRCPAFTQFKEQDPERLEWNCHVMEAAAIKAYAAAVNPDIQIKALKVGLEGKPDEIACQWEFKLAR